MKRLCIVWKQTAHRVILVRPTFLPRRSQPFLMRSGNSGGDIGTWHYVDEGAKFVRGLKINETIKEPFSPYFFVFYMHVPATIIPNTSPCLNLY